MRPVGPADLVERVKRAQVDVGVEVAPAGGPELAEHLRHRHDRRTEVEPVPVLGHGGGPPADDIQLVENRDAVAFRAEPHRRGEAAEARADDDGFAPGIGYALHPEPRRPWWRLHVSIQIYNPAEVRFCHGV